jgi:hypothetical protein
MIYIIYIPLITRNYKHEPYTQWIGLLKLLNNTKPLLLAGFVMSFSYTCRFEIALKFNIYE